MPYAPPPDLATLDLAEIAALVAARTLPPVEQWHPASTGDSKMRIDAQGRWFHDNGEIKRPAMVRAFASLLRREEDGSFVLVTPYEKQRIDVEDAPFQAVEVQQSAGTDGPVLTFRLNTDDLVMAGPDHRLTFHDLDDAPRAYLHVRGGLLARLNRPVFYTLVELALASGAKPPFVESMHARFTLDASA
jgi:uncharacterized protein